MRARIAAASPVIGTYYTAYVINANCQTERNREGLLLGEVTLSESIICWKKAYNF